MVEPFSAWLRRPRRSTGCKDRLVLRQPGLCGRPNRVLESGGSDAVSRPQPTPKCQIGRKEKMSKFKIVTPKGASFTVAGGGYAFEKEALDPIGAEIIEAPAKEAEFIAAARAADAIYAKGMPISKTIIDALDNSTDITLGTLDIDRL